MSGRLVAAPQLKIDISHQCGFYGMFLRCQFLYARTAKTHSSSDVSEQSHARKGLADAVPCVFGSLFLFFGCGRLRQCDLRPKLKF
jgi:hypothetical protein